jgi:AraC family transcriptional regulator, regulatory protein of adaptative response / methylated-DNA-[protein]-cysteine methyltransferase
VTHRIVFVFQLRVRGKIGLKLHPVDTFDAFICVGLHKCVQLDIVGISLEQPAVGADVGCRLGKPDARTGIMRGYDGISVYRPLRNVSGADTVWCHALKSSAANNNPGIRGPSGMTASDQARSGMPGNAQGRTRSGVAQYHPKEQETECAPGPQVLEWTARHIPLRKPASGPQSAMKETIRYAWGAGSLGEFIAASSDYGLVALEFGVRDGPLTSALRGRFPEADLVEDSTSLKESVEKATSLIEHPHSGANIPLDLRGSDFQRQVWAALQEIPPGRTISYVELACRIGGPLLAQEVGEACAANTIAVLIPCHRVLKKDGGISGYRWGTWRKRVLLEREYLEHFTLT